MLVWWRAGRKTFRIPACQNMVHYLPSVGSRFSSGLPLKAVEGLPKMGVNLLGALIMKSTVFCGYMLTGTHCYGDAPDQGRVKSKRGFGQF